MGITTLGSNSLDVAHYGADCLAVYPAPIQLLTNGRLSTMISATGAGFVNFGPLSVTRWRPEPTGEGLGCLFYLRDLETNEYWSLGFYPTCATPDDYGMRISAGSATITRLDREIASTMEVCVHPEWDFDLRRCTVVNHSRVARAIEVTSYAEVVLQDGHADASHPAFSNLFVQTGKTNSGILHARRRPRTGDEKTLSGCHFLMSDGQDAQPVELETDRRRFVGRGHTLCNPLAMQSAQRLSGTVGSVLDPIFSLRTVLLLPPGASASAIFALGAGNSHSQLLESAEQLAGALDFDEVRQHADRAAQASLEQAGIRHREVPQLLAYAAGRLRGFAEPVPAAVKPAIAHEFLARFQIPERQTAPPAKHVGMKPSRRDGGAKKSPTSPARRSTPSTDRSRSESSPGREPLQFDNGFGGFSADGREYVLRLSPNANGQLNLPPVPWHNVVASENAGFIISERGAGNSWTANSRLNRLTPWFNDTVVEPHSEALYLRDEETGEFWSLTPGPTPHKGAYEVRHGWGYSVFQHDYSEIDHEVTMFVPRHDSVRISRVRLTNHGSRPRRLRLVSYCQWELGEALPHSRLATSTEIDSQRRTIFATNSSRGEFSQRVAFATLALDASNYQFTADRLDFVGLHGDLAAPRALRDDEPLAGLSGTGWDPCAVIEGTFELQPGQTLQGAFLLGEGENRVDSTTLIERYQSNAQVDQALAEVRQFWQNTVAAVQIETPSREIDLMVNGWLTYQNMSCRLFGRSSSYQSGGAYGFRDQLQDVAAPVHHSPELTRRQILLNAAHQFVEGDVMHWWHPPESRGMRTVFSDDLLWLPLVACEYVQATGDDAVWHEQARFITAEQVPPGYPELFLKPQDSGQRGSVFEHCCRALDRGLTCGANGLPLMGCGDWNDGMSRVGIGGAGESVWLGFFIDYILERFLPVCRQFGDESRFARYSDYRAQLRVALNDAGWDGQWYRRAYFDDGTPLGTDGATECRIDALVQAWAVLSGAAPPERAAAAIAAADRRLVDEKGGIIRLLDPPFDVMPHDPGYIKGYVPGVHENGGQYTHGVLWLVRAIAELGQGTRACQLLEMLSPVSHGQTPEAVATYKGEPYVVAADVYGKAPHIGRAGWPWYTGSAGWMFRVAVETILGIHLERGEQLRIDPRIAATWPECRVRYRLPDGRTVYNIHIQNPRGKELGVTAATLDDQPISVESNGAIVPLSRDGCEHHVVVAL